MTIASETRISLEEAAKQLGVQRRTVKRYCVDGINGIRLEWIPRPRREETSVEAIERFLTAIQQKADSTLPPESKPPIEDRRRALRAERGTNRK